ncbi:MAG: anaerobic ribonucleoside-triphosphate reductase [Lentisphaeria bacterium]
MATATTKAAFDAFRKRNGMEVPFRPDKIKNAVHHAAEVVARKEGRVVDPSIAERITDRVMQELDNPLCEYYVFPSEDNRRIPAIEDVQDLVEIMLSENGYPEIMTAYKRYRKQREVARRNIFVRNKENDEVDVTDASLLLVHSVDKSETSAWNRDRIVEQLLDETQLSSEIAVSVAKEVENQVINSEVKTLTTSLIRELVNNELAERECNQQLKDLSLYRVPKDFIERLMFTKSTENSNIVNNNPEAVNLGLAELILKQWGLDTIFSNDVKRAHETGSVHIHDLGYPHRVYCSSHSIEYVKKYGLRDLSNLNTESNPARSASVLTGHLNTFLASMQANYAGALGIAYINIFYAPYLKGMSAEEMKQVAQELIFNGSQNAFSRGGQTLFLDFNIHTGVPRYLRDVPAVGPGGHYMMRLANGHVVELEEQMRDDTDPSGNALANLYYTDSKGNERLVRREIHTTKDGLTHDPEIQAELDERGETIVTYGDYEKEAREFTEALLSVWSDGDRNGRVFEFPKCDFHISEETFQDPAQHKIFMKACELASKNGSTYFIFDRDEVTLSACCRLRTTIEDNRMLKHPESMRFCGFQNVTINIPQAGFRASRAGNKSLAGLYEEIDRTMELAVEAHMQKQEKIAEMMSEPGRPLHQIGREACDGRPYVELDKCTYIIGLIGVNDVVKFLTGEELHESENAMETGLRIVSHMYIKAKKLSKKHGIKLTLEESPAESAARRLAKTDLLFFRKESEDIVKGDSEDVAYYTNSVHLSAEAPVSLVERIREQAKFHSVIESGAITHAFVGEEQPSADSVAELARETLYRTQTAQLTISPEFTYCNDCYHSERGLNESCTRCGSEDIVGETRVVGYFSKIQNWNKSKRYGELIARQRGRYAVESADGDQFLEEDSPAELVTA